MKPFLFSIGSSRIPSFFFFIMVATLATTLFLFWRSRKEGFPPEVMLDIGIIGMLAGVLGARIFHILVEAPDYYWAKPMRVFQFWRGGFVSWGGLLGIAVAFFIYFRMRKLPLLPYLDFCATGFPIVKIFVRVACLLTGCCYGKPTSLPWAITFHDHASTAYYYFPDIPLHPTQIYSIIHATVLFLFMQWFYKHHKQNPGESICALVIGWSLPRAFIEFFRGDADRGVYFGGHISTGQIMGLLISLVAFILYRHFHGKYKKVSTR